MVRIGHIITCDPAGRLPYLIGPLRGRMLGAHMAVRIRLRIMPRTGSRVGGVAFETTAIVNSGFEANEPELIVPVSLATSLGWQPLPPGASSALYGTAGGAIQVDRIPDAATVAVLPPSGAKSVERSVTAVISRLEIEALISDKLADDLGLVLIAPGAGLWQLRDRLTEQPFPSEPPQTW